MGPSPDHPRIRGEHLDHRHPPGAGAGSSPHTRGARRPRPPSRRPDGIIPAYAGSTRRRRPHPDVDRGSSPHTRGAPRSTRRHPRPCGIIPAYAGSTPSGTSRRGISRDHPRIRGEHLGYDRQEHVAEGSSPHTRGAPGGIGAAGPHARIIPAYAGSTRSDPRGPPAGEDHPRIRGEHRPVFLSASQARGSSPHTRGALGAAAVGGRLPRIIPAYAGSTVPCSSRSRSRRDHPRIRGEHPPPEDLLQYNNGIIPAYAGSTGSPASSGRGSGDHPRIRGEHRWRWMAPTRSDGSSPHTRGAPHRNRLPVYREGIIPAYAGSTAVVLDAGVRDADHPRIRGEHDGWPC